MPITHCTLGTCKLHRLWNTSAAQKTCQNPCSSELCLYHGTNQFPLQKVFSWCSWIPCIHAGLHASTRAVVIFVETARTLILYRVVCVSGSNDVLDKRLISGTIDLVRILKLSIIYVSLFTSFSLRTCHRVHMYRCTCTHTLTLTLFRYLLFLPSHLKLTPQNGGFPWNRKSWDPLHTNSLPTHTKPRLWHCLGSSSLPVLQAQNTSKFGINNTAQLTSIHYLCQNIIWKI